MRQSRTIKKEIPATRVALRCGLWRAGGRVEPCRRLRVAVRKRRPQGWHPALVAGVDESDLAKTDGRYI